MDRRGGKLRVGCLGGLALGLGVVLAVYAIIAPWSLHMGGRWTPGAWWGYGTLRTTTGAQYPLFVLFYPNPRSTSRLRYQGRRPSIGLGGSAWLCTAPGVTQRLDISGDIYGVYLRTDGGLINFRLLEPRRIDLGQRRRYFDLYGEWRGAQVVMADNGSWRRSFRPGPPDERAAVTFSWGSYWDFKALCGGGK